MAALAVRYGAALAALALESGAPEAYRAEAAIILEALKDEDCRKIIEHPKISSQGKREFVDDVFAPHIGADMLGFLYLVIDKNREEFLAEGLQNLIERLDEIAGKIKATAVCARQPNETQLATINKLARDKLGEKVELSIEVDSALIGGFYIQTSSHLFDFTVRKQLAQMKVQLAKGVVG
ncbi:MAG: ATP synthase F1 subunit delta [Oscillospiraceae bacterium]|nr:ATP synthase F1 subunit delta [Oscillospiraceae bacterium]